MRITLDMRMDMRVVTRIKPLRAMQVVDFPDIEENKGATAGTDFTDLLEDERRRTIKPMATRRRSGMRMVRKDGFVHKLFLRMKPDFVTAEFRRGILRDWDGRMNGTLIG